MIRKLAVCLAIPMLMFAASKEKNYVSLQDVIFDTDCIWVRVGEQLTPTDQLHVDEMGYYVLSKSEDSWRCSKCGFVNPGSYPGRGCRVCDFPFDFNN